jgi:streptothricin acetyltransferase
MPGLMLGTQDINLAACRFYHHCGFKLGAVDTMLYWNFPTRDEKALFWYMPF